MKKHYTEQTQKILNAIREIPFGKVDSYGNVAFRAGYPNGARQVSRVLHSLSEKEELPWYRVVNAKGEIALSNEGAEIQKVLLAGEGVCVVGRKVDLTQYGFSK